MEDTQEGTPTLSPRSPVVGIGASAGGLEALEAFFDATPPDTGLAFVVVTHQHPGHSSLLPELLGHHTEMPVEVVDAPTRVQPNHLYLTLPGRDLAIEEGTLRAREMPEGAPRRLPIDRFFRSLARDQGERAIGVVLSGTGTDGSLGVKEIKGAAGLVIAQSRESARYAGMPSSAVATGAVDYVLNVEEMPAQLVAYAAGAFPLGDEVAPAAAPSELVQEVLKLLFARMGHDFSDYKTSMVQRRIERRMNVHHVDEPRGYLKLLEEDPNEAATLFKELLVGVTSFFRDAEAFAVLDASLPSLIEHAAEDGVVRVWVPGCATGEEAYSIAMLLRERVDQVEKRLKLRVFATDLDESAIDVARAGVYPDGIAADVSSERLGRFFAKGDGNYRVTKELREHVIFAPQNLIVDPPFAKLDLLSCRNVLMYLNDAEQRHLLSVFHHVLKPGGLLFLGSSESIGAFGHLFGVVDKKWKVFRRREVARDRYVDEFTLSRRRAAERAMRGKREASPVDDDVHQVLLSNLVPPSVLVQPGGEVVHIHGHVGAFLEPASGAQPNADVFNMAREGLRLVLAAAMRQARTQVEPVELHGVRVKSEGTQLFVDLRVQRLAEPERFAGLLLVSFLRPRPFAKPDEGFAQTPPAVARFEELERELQFAKEINQSAMEELETANEELKSTNEELQSSNEELQSSNEELETSKEEMQSLNEELQTVNAELQGKVEELACTTDDMRNLLNGTEIATLFLDADLRVKRYTDQAKEVIRLIPTDVGRPIGDLVSSLHYDDLAEDAQEVLRTLVAKEAEVRANGDTWYLMRMLPYRTTDNVIDGLVVTFVDITTVKSLQAVERRLVRALENSETKVFEQDTQLRVTWASGPIFGWGPEAIRGKRPADVLDPEQGARLTASAQGVLESGRPAAVEVRSTVNGIERVMEVAIEAARTDDGEVVGLTSIASPVPGGGS